MEDKGRIQNPEDSPVGTAKIGSRWTRFWWVWLVVVIAIFWVFGWAWFGSGGWWGSTRTARAAITGPGVTILNSTNRQSFIGANFRVTNVIVQNKVNDRAYWITTPNSNPMLVLTNPQEPSEGMVKKGAQVNVDGVVAAAPSEMTVEQQWGLNAADAMRVEQQGVYVQAFEVRSSQAARTGGRAGTLR